MKKFTFAPVCVVLAASLFVGCGAKDERVAPSSGLASDDAQSEAAVAASFGEAMDSMSDTNMSSNSGTAMALENGLGVEVQITMDRSCAASDDKAVVTITRDKEMSWKRSNARISVSASASIENDIVRTWSLDGGSVGCELNNKVAAIDFEADLTGYELDVSIKRNATRSLEKTVARTRETTKRSLTSAVDGTRHAKWLSQETNDDGSISRSKSISFSVSRTDNFVAKDGSVKDLALRVETKEDLQVTTTWDNLAHDRQLLSKLISSGVVKASKAADSYVEASFNKLLMKFDAKACSVYSGSMEARIYAEGSTEAAKIYMLTAVEGSITVKDVTDPANPKDVEDFEYSPCDLKDFNY
ncbi:MAG TPA: hypothetical protein VFO10_06840 [Oligoflexus sp.]|uniref:hypothetical protein n=1 Tax=Oligoflexus sp. TaxID=1971216 RepID=UPI002D8097DD|nr:hypothetical protein [Oligoflexus sp.]HET9236948.1 hypothetical protein [Oligoflexus sp.]